MNPGETEIRFVDAGGLRLRVVIDAPLAADRSHHEELGVAPLVVLHGFTGSAASMSCVSAPLGRDRRVARIELVGHGESDAPDSVEFYSMEACADQIAAVVEDLAWRRPALLGYSMGGRAALAAAVRHPGAFSSLVLVGATAGIEDPALRRERIRSDEALADRIEREGIEAFVEAWMALPLFATQSRLGAAALAVARAERLRGRPQGLANSLRGMGAGAQPPLFHALDRIREHVLLVAGEEDVKFRAIAEDLAKRLPDARSEIIDGVGHAAHLESPTRFASVAGRFLADCDPTWRSKSRAPTGTDPDARNPHEGRPE